MNEQKAAVQGDATAGAGGARTDARTEAETLRLYEDEQARRRRGECTACGHTWRPRNPSTKQTRCPACARRGVAVITVLDVA